MGCQNEKFVSRANNRSNSSECEYFFFLMNRIIRFWYSHEHIRSISMVTKNVSFISYYFLLQTHTIHLPCALGTATIKTKSQHILSIVHRRNFNELDNNKTALQRYDTIQYTTKLSEEKPLTVIVWSHIVQKKEDTTLLRYSSAYSSCSTGLRMSKSSTSWYVLFADLVGSICWCAKRVNRAFTSQQFGWCVYHGEWLLIQCY